MFVHHNQATREIHDGRRFVDEAWDQIMDDLNWLMTTFVETVDLTWKKGSAGELVFSVTDDRDDSRKLEFELTGPMAKGGLDRKLKISIFQEGTSKEFGGWPTKLPGMQTSYSPCFFRQSPETILWLWEMLPAILSALAQRSTEVDAMMERFRKIGARVAELQRA